MTVSLRPGAASRFRLRVLCAVVLASLSGVYLAAPNGWGGLAFFAAAGGGLLSFVVAPLVHRPVNRGPWLWLTAAGAMFLGGLLLRLEAIGISGPLGDADLWAFAGYACTAPFLLGLLRRTQAGWDPALWLDTAAITTGSALIGWVMNVAPQLTGAHPHLGVALVNAVYPVMDALLLTLTVQLGFRRGSGIPSLEAALVGLTALLIGDLAYTFIWVSHPGAVNPLVNVAYIVAYGSLGLMAGHPSMRDLSDIDVQHTPVTSRARIILIFLAMLTPASIPIMLPTHGALDAAVRAVIMSVFAGLVFLRLLRTIHALQNAETQATYRATHDGLTHLPNRVAFLEQLDRHLIDSVSGGGSVNVLLIGFDHFRKINDTWGHAAGDEFLVQITARLRSALSPKDLLSRAGGDQFAVRLDTFTEGAIEAALDRLQAAFQVPLEISSERMSHLTITIGVARSPHDGGETAENLLRDADQAYTQAKAAGRGTVATHDDQMSTRILRRHRLAEELDGALDRGEIHVVYQPIRTGANYGELSGWEALARWQHPELGTISPVEFIPIAEDTGLILPIGEFVLGTACTQLAAWQHTFSSPGLHMSVNVSSVQLMRDELATKVSNILTQTGITSTSLWLEITESVLLDHTTDAVSELNALAELGVKLCLDDFGTGFSSLSYLKDFHIDFLKIDRSFIMQLVNDHRNRSLAQAMINLAAALDMEGVVAEGIETREQAAVLTELGCSHVQGYLYGRPELAHEAAISLASLIASQEKPTPPPRLPSPRSSQRPVPVQPTPG